MHRGLKSRTPAASGLQPRVGPSDFFLFGYIKRKLSEYNCESREEPLSALIEFLTVVDQEALPSVFESWVIKHEGTDYPQ
jgi:hypothetical protein